MIFFCTSQCKYYFFTSSVYKYIQQVQQTFHQVSWVLKVSSAVWNDEWFSLGFPKFVFFAVTTCVYLKKRLRHSSTYRKLRSFPPPLITFPALKHEYYYCVLAPRSIVFAKKKPGRPGYYVNFPSGYQFFLTLSRGMYFPWFQVGFLVCKAQKTS